MGQGLRLQAISAGVLGLIRGQVTRSHRPQQRFTCHSYRSRMLQLRPSTAKIYKYLNIEKKKKAQSCPCLGLRSISALPEAPDSVQSD